MKAPLSTAGAAGHTTLSDRHCSVDTCLAAGGSGSGSGRPVPTTPSSPLPARFPDGRGEQGVPLLDERRSVDSGPDMGEPAVTRALWDSTEEGGCPLACLPPHIIVPTFPCPPASGARASFRRAGGVHVQYCNAHAQHPPPPPAPTAHDDDLQRLPTNPPLSTCHSSRLNELFQAPAPPLHIPPNAYGR